MVAASRQTMAPRRYGLTGEIRKFGDTILNSAYPAARRWQKENSLAGGGKAASYCPGRERRKPALAALYTIVRSHWGKVRPCSQKTTTNSRRPLPAVGRLTNEEYWSLTSLECKRPVNCNPPTTSPGRSRSRLVRRPRWPRASGQAVAGEEGGVAEDGRGGACPLCRPRPHVPAWS
jgi:hypothetical protein